MGKNNWDAKSSRESSVKIILHLPSSISHGLLISCKGKKRIHSGETKRFDKMTKISTSNDEQKNAVCTQM